MMMTLKNKCLVLAFACCLMLCAPLAVYAQKNVQQPITDKDVQTYLNLFNQMINAGEDKEKINTAIINTGWDDQRFYYVSDRIEKSLQIIEKGDEVSKKIAPADMPSPAELEAVRKHMPEFIKAAEKLGKR